MGVGVAFAVKGIFAYLASEGVAAVVLRTILLNVVLGSLEIVDDNGEVLHAVDHD